MPASRHDRFPLSSNLKTARMTDSSGSISGPVPAPSTRNEQLRNLLSVLKSQPQPDDEGLREVLSRAVQEVEQAVGRSELPQSGSPQPAGNDHHPRNPRAPAQCCQQQHTDRLVQG